MRQTLRLIKLHFNFAPMAVLYLVVWTITNHILVAQFNSDFCGHIRELIRIGNGKHAAAGDLRNFSEQGGTGNLFLRTGTAAGAGA